MRGFCNLCRVAHDQDEIPFVQVLTGNDNAGFVFATQVGQSNLLVTPQGYVTGVDAFGNANGHRFQGLTGQGGGVFCAHPFAGDSHGDNDDPDDDADRVSEGVADCGLRVAGDAGGRI